VGVDLNAFDTVDLAIAYLDVVDAPLGGRAMTQRSRTGFRHKILVERAVCNFILHLPYL